MALIPGLTTLIPGLITFIPGLTRNLTLSF